MRIHTIVAGALTPLAAAQTAGPYTDARSGITFNTFQHSSGAFVGLALPASNTGSTDFIATIGGKSTSWTGVSLGGGMLNELLIVAWPNEQRIVSSFRKTANYGSPAVASGSFTQNPIINGTYVNSTHWTYTFLCSKCIQGDGTTFNITDTAASLGYAINTKAPAQRSDPASSVSKHTAQGQAGFDLSKARNSNFDIWKAYAVATTSPSRLM
ncbi:hypothetical protein ACN47E_000003 [Coniothyrium glycines]